MSGCTLTEPHKLGKVVIEGDTVYIGASSADNLTGQVKGETGIYIFDLTESSNSHRNYSTAQLTYRSNIGPDSMSKYFHVSKIKIFIIQMYIVIVQRLLFKNPTIVLLHQLIQITFVKKYKTNYLIRLIMSIARCAKLI